MKNSDLKRINDFFKAWKGATARFNKYTISHNRFVLELIRPGTAESTGVSFSFCEYIAGPTHWTNSELVCEPWQAPSGEMGYEVRDKKAGFVVRGTDVVNIEEEQEK